MAASSVASSAGLDAVLFQLGDGLRVEVGAPYLCAFAREGERGGAADALACGGHESGFPY
jgi:hypothetical protein